MNRNFFYHNSGFPTIYVGEEQEYSDDELIEVSEYSELVEFLEEKGYCFYDIENHIIDEKTFEALKNKPNGTSVGIGAAVGL